MPYINTVTTTKITDEARERLTKEYGKAIELVKGKTEKWLMLRFEDGAKMAFRGNSKADSAIVEVELLGEAEPSDLSALTAKICDMLSSELSLDSTRIYVKYFSTKYWGYDGDNF